MKTSVEVHFDHLLIMQDFLKVLKEHRVFFYSGNPEDEVVSEEERVRRVNFIKNYKPAGRGYDVSKLEWYEQ